jgi:predicted Zn-dependent protease
MVDEVATVSAVPTGRDRREFVKGMRKGLVKTFEYRSTWTPWQRHEVRNIRKRADDDLVVVVRHRCKEGVVLKMRWWLTARAGAWKVYDMEDLDLGLRASSTIGLLTQQVFRPGGRPNQASLARVQQLSRDSQAIFEAVHALGEDNPELAEQKLQSVAGTELPDWLDAVRLMARGALYLHRGKAKEALGELDRARQKRADMSILDKLCGAAYTHLGEWAKGLDYLDRYRSLVGDDPFLCQTRGTALRGLSRFKEAAACYRKALDEHPTDADSFLGLLNALADTDPREDVPERFARLDRRRDTFVACAADCVDNRDARGIEQMAEVMRKSDPDFAPVDYYLSLARAWQGKPPEAVTLYRSALAREKDDKKRQEYEEGFLKAMAGPGKAVAAYGAAASARPAFRTLAGTLKDTSQMAELKLLVQAHAQKDAGDPVLPLYQGAVHVWEGNHLQAEKAFAQGLLRSPDRPTLQRFRASRVLARHHAGDPLGAYRDIGPREETFVQLADLLLVARDNDRLQALLDEHAKHAPRSPDLPRYRCRLLLRQGKVEQGIAVFRSMLAAQAQPEKRNQLVSVFLADMLQARRPVEGYQAAPDPRAAFEQLASELDDDDRWDELRKLVAAHRARQPDDVLLDYYTGQLHVEDLDWGKAAEAFGRGWKKAGKEQKPRFRSPYVHALYKAGRTTQAYKEVEPRRDTFEQLANLLTIDGKGAELKELVELHRKQEGEDAALLYHASRAELLLKRAGQAVALFQQAYRKQANEHLRNSWAYKFVRALAEAGPALEAYRACPNRAGAFSTLAPLLLYKKRTAELVELLDEHGKTHRDDPNWLSQAGELYLLHGDLATAEQCFAAALRRVQGQAGWAYRNGLNRARVRAGKTVATYQEAPDRRAAFAELASLCATTASPGELEALVAAHRRLEPADPDLPIWEVELCWLKKDYEGASNRLTTQRAALLQSPRWRWKFEGYLVRSLVRAKKTGQAVEEARSLVRADRSDRLLLVLAHAANGDVKQAIAAAEKLAEGPARQRCYQDEDLGPLLKSETMAAFRERFPETKKGQAVQR